MTRTPPPKPQRPTPPAAPPQGRESADEAFIPKPYELISFPKTRPTLQHPAGHDKYLSDHLHGTLFLTLTVKTAVHISTGVVVMGSDIGNSRIPLIKTMVQNTDQKLSIQGSSLKGCIRSVYEAITNSTLAVVTSRYRSQIPVERLPCRKKEELCPASRVFGALDWQGLVEFSDAKCQSSGSATGFMPSLYRPRPDQRRAYFMQGKVAGRKFYYHTVRAIDKGQNQGIPVQEAATEYAFTTELHFKNLKIAELGTLLIVLGQDSQYPIALKVGGGKPIGMGTMTVTVDAIDRMTGKQSLKDRYASYTLPESAHLTGEALQQFMQQQIKAAHASKLIEQPQLAALFEVLRYPTDREAPSGMY
jgi:hypothetical protein